MADAEWTLDRHLSGKAPDVVALYERFIALAEECGPFTYSVAKTAITLKGTRRGFAGVVLGDHGIRGYFDVQRSISDPRISSVSPYTKRLFVHHFRVQSPEQLDDEFAGWLREAYAVGAGAHMEGPQQKGVDGGGRRDGDDGEPS